MKPYISRLCAEYALANGLYELPIKFAKVKELVEKEGYELISYNQIAASGDKVIHLFQLDKYAHKLAYTVCAGGVKAICYADKLSYAVRNFVLMHEIGHIKLDHVSYGVAGKSATPELGNEQEAEADAFAYYLLAPPHILAANDISSVPDIERATLLNRKYAARARKYILRSLINSDPLSSAERELMKKYKEKRAETEDESLPALKSKRIRRINRMWAATVIPLLIIAAIFLYIYFL